MKLKITLFAMLFMLLAIPQALQAATNATVQKEGLQVRDTPALSGNIMTSLNVGSSFPVLDEEYGWVQLQIDRDTTGWVAGYLVEMSNDKDRSVATSASDANIATVAVDELRVRSDSSRTSEILGSLNAGEQIEVTGSSHGWAAFSYKGHDAYVADQFITYSSSAPKSAPKKETTERVEDKKTVNDDGSYVRSIVEGARVRTEPTTDSRILTTLQKGAELHYLGSEGDWFTVETMDGQQGFIANWIAEAVHSSPSIGTASSIETTSMEKNEQTEQNSSDGLSLQGKTIVIDPGHGGREPGTIGSQGTLEKTVTLQTAQRLANQLNALGATVILTRSADEYVSLRNRVNISENSAADAFLSLHFDGYEETKATGITSFYMNGSGRLLAESLQPEMVAQTTMTDRGAREGNYHVLRENSRPAVLLELGFMTNPADELKIITSSYQKNVVKGIVKGLQAHFSNVQ
ncbi:SH3 domain-containing protein [Bacillaceae bacterium SIJ1]|uniref:N-acetylmuramoyl-L-alanine amidase n=1 Tax=Litoribacterium kuwaitense TaxID=1398745 RepID=UPI0013EB301D|nr:N-acetylmuramoyl-L-alanine amidase [Litoribacterium kuwaitense]NGP43445.1 SH3 domain-containing protein [Litoribacterium kuwaitense]